jgi:hypothetical protein
MGSEQERLQISGLTQYQQITGTTNIALHHSDASVVNRSAEPRFLNLNPEGSAGLLKSDNAESSHSVSF